jgi:hypothetical protein
MAAHSGVNSQNHSTHISAKSRFFENGTSTKLEKNNKFNNMEKKNFTDRDIPVQ